MVIPNVSTPTNNPTVNKPPASMEKNKKVKTTSPSKTKSTAEVEADVLKAHAERFRVFSTSLSNLVAALKTHRETMIQNRKAQDEVTRQIIKFSKGSPISTNIDREAAPSFTIVNQMIKKSAIASEDKYEASIVHYTSEWEKIVKTKFNAELKEANESHKWFQHYQKKVQKLQTEKQQFVTKKKEYPPKTEEKLERNIRKLEEAEHEYYKHKGSLEQVTVEFIDHSWKDLYPLVLNVLNFDKQEALEKSSLVVEIKNVVKELSKVAEQHDIKPDGRTVTLPNTTSEKLHSAPAVEKPEKKNNTKVEGVATKDDSSRDDDSSV